MTKPFKRIIAVGIAFILIALAASFFVMTGGCSQKANSAQSPLDDARNAALNTLLDASGIKSHLESELYKHAGTIAEQTGIPESTVNNAISSLAISEWEVVSLPQTANEAAHVSIDTEEFKGSVTTYDTPEIVTVDAYGQSLTMKVPPSAQTYVSFLEYFG